MQLDDGTDPLQPQQHLLVHELNSIVQPAFLLRLLFCSRSPTDHGCCHHTTVIRDVMASLLTHFAIKQAVLVLNDVNEMKKCRETILFSYKFSVSLALFLFISLPAVSAFSTRRSASSSTRRRIVRSISRVNCAAKCCSLQLFWLLMKQTKRQKEKNDENYVCAHWRSCAVHEIKEGRASGCMHCRPRHTKACWK